jgi:hypothetical protein
MTASEANHKRVLDLIRAEGEQTVEKIDGDRKGPALKRGHIPAFRQLSIFGRPDMTESADSLWHSEIAS